MVFHIWTRIKSGSDDFSHWKRCFSASLPIQSYGFGKRSTWRVRVTSLFQVIFWHISPAFWLKSTSLSEHERDSHGLQVSLRCTVDVLKIAQIAIPIWYNNNNAYNTSMRLEKRAQRSPFSYLYGTFCFIFLLTSAILKKKKSSPKHFLQSRKPESTTSWKS